MLKRNVILAPGLLWFAAACTPKPAPPSTSIVTVEAVDYAFQLPDTLRAGPTTFRMHNGGKVPHEMVMALLKPGVTMSQLMDHVGAGGSPDSVVTGIVGILIATPGETTVGALSTDLLPGRTYALICSFKDGPDTPEHIALGMFSGRTIGAAP